MCRLLGIVSSEETDFRLVLRDAPKSLAALSPQHPDGWGIAIHGGGAREAGRAWHVVKGVACASEDAAFHAHAHGSRGRILVSHIRKKTVGPTSLANTHPFTTGPWVFAHNGTIEDVAWVRSRTSAARLAEVRGNTDSELFFAHVLTRLDDTPPDRVDAALASLTDEARARPRFGAFNFLLSNGETLYAHRAGRSLFLLERGPHDEVRVRRKSDESGATVETPWSQRRRAIFVASERMTDEPWQEIPEATCLRVDGVGGAPSKRDITHAHRGRSPAM